MRSDLKPKKTTHPFNKAVLTLASASLLSLVLTGCPSVTGGSNVNKPSDHYGTASTESAAYYLKEANKRQGAAQASWKLKAAAAYARNKRYSSAYNTLLTFQPTELEASQRNAYYLLKGESALQLQKSFEAIRALQAVTHPEAQSLDWNRHYQLLMADTLTANKRYADAAVTRLKTQPLLDSQAHIDEQFNTAWQELKQSPLGALEAKSRRATDPAIMGWLDLAIIQKRYENNARLMAQGLQTWSAQHPNHPGIQYVSTNVQQLSNAEFIAPTKVGLIVPLTGRFAKVGSIIRDGFIAAYFEKRAGRGEIPSVQVYDSANGDGIEQIYQKAMADGVDMVVGPLLKHNIDRLTHLSTMPIPTLVLNRLDSSFAPANLYQFGLPIEDEAEQIARFAVRKNQMRAFVINANGRVGERAVESFRQTFEQEGGTVVQVATITKDQDPKTVITHLLGVDKVEKRSKELQNLLNLPIESSGQGSAGADAIFLISDRQKARTIKPYLNYYYAYNLPVYATSEIYPGTTSKQLDNDLSGIVFTDAPWMLAVSDDIKEAKKSVKNTLPNSHSSLGRFFALGFDAYAIIPELGQLSALSDAAIDGLTGILSVDQYGRVKRQMAWGRYQNGEVRAYNEQ